MTKKRGGWIVTNRRFTIGVSLAALRLIGVKPGEEVAFSQVRRNSFVVHNKDDLEESVTIVQVLG